jgi:hypothetical protein
MTAIPGRAATEIVVVKVAVATRTAEKGAVLKLATDRGAVPERAAGKRAAGKLATANVAVP